MRGGTWKQWESWLPLESGLNCWEWTGGRHCLTWPLSEDRPWRGLQTEETILSRVVEKVNRYHYKRGLTLKRTPKQETLLRQSGQIWWDIWKRTVGKSKTNATSVIRYLRTDLEEDSKQETLLGRVVEKVNRYHYKRGLTLKRTPKQETLLRQSGQIWWDIWKRTVGKSKTNATSVIRYLRTDLEEESKQERHYWGRVVEKVKRYHYKRGLTFKRSPKLGLQTGDDIGVEWGKCETNSGQWSDLEKLGRCRI